MQVGVPRDPAQWLALVASLAIVVFGARILRPPARPRWFVGLAALAAAALSAGYVAVYLRGGPRIIDATSYWLEAREMARGHVTWPLVEPVSSSLGRFIVRSEGADGPRAAVIFPPGYPALLALGFLARAPMIVGPLLAAAICAATYGLARAVERELLRLEAPAVSIPVLATLLSVVCAALRYHTADTMSHGLAALCFAGSLAGAFGALDDRAAGGWRWAALSGLAAGWLVAARPASGAALALALLAVFTRPAASPSRLRLAGVVALAALPGVVLLVVHQRLATGANGVSSQALYYAVSDGPPGCFRYGFGSGIGCLGEHGEFVRSRLADGYGLVAALGTTLRRLKMHVLDVANLEPLALLVPAGAVLGWGSQRVRLLALAVVLQIAAYAPFYFDGNYPGGGARLFADVLPLEHVLCAVAVVSFAARRDLGERAARGVLALALAGFSIRAGFEHAMLRDREGGRPMFEPSRLASAGVTEGLVFVDTDHGYDLGAVPSATDDRVTVARLHGDALDLLAWQAKGRPPAYRYRYAWAEGQPADVRVEPLRLGEAGGSRIEGESLWPPLRQEGAWALSEHTSVPSCSSGGRWLVVHPAPAGAVTLELPARALAARTLTPHVAISSEALARIELIVDGQVAPGWSITSGGAAPRDPPIAGTQEPVACLTLEPARLPSGANRVELHLVVPASASLFALDRLDLGDPE